METDKIKLQIRYQLWKVKFKEHKCADQGCLISAAKPLIGLDDDFLVEIIYSCYEERRILFEKGVNCFWNLNTMPALAEEMIDESIIFLIEFGQSLKNNFLSKDRWISLVKASQDSKEAIESLLFFAFLILMMEERKAALLREAAQLN